MNVTAALGLLILFTGVKRAGPGQRSSRPQVGLRMAQGSAPSW